MKKTKVKIFWYKPNCQPRIFINPNYETMLDIKKEGEYLTNPNEGSIKGIPLAHTYPDHKNNMIRPLKLSYRSNIKNLANPIKQVKVERDLDLRKASIYLKTHELQESEYKEEIKKSLKKSLSIVDMELDQLYNDLNDLQSNTIASIMALEIQRNKDLKRARNINICCVIGSILTSVGSLLAGHHYLWGGL